MNIFKPAEQGKIVSARLRELLLEQPDLPVMMTITCEPGSTSTFRLGVDTNADIKHAQDTNYGDIDLARVVLDVRHGSRPLTSHALARSLPDMTDLPVKIVHPYYTTAFLIGSDVVVSVEEHNGEQVCMMRTRDTGDA